MKYNILSVPIDSINNTNVFLYSDIKHSLIFLIIFLINYYLDITIYNIRPKKIFLIL